MPRREDFENSLWSDPDFAALTPQAKLLYVWTWTNPRCGMSGLYKCALSAPALETGMELRDVEDAIEDLDNARFVFYEDGVFFVRTRVKHLRQKTPQIAKAIRNDLKQVSNAHPLKAKFRETYEGPEWLSIAFQGDPQEGPVDGPHPGDGHVTVYGTGTGTGRGKGSFRNTRARELSKPYAPDPEMLAMRDHHFPGLEVSTLEGAAFTLRRRKMDVTPAAIRALIGDVA
jgi:hypothetical protein